MALPVKFGQTAAKPARGSEASQGEPTTQVESTIEGAGTDTVELAPEPAEPPEPKHHLFTIHPWINLQLGRFHFTKSQLKVAPEDLEEFKALHAQQPVQIKNQIQEISQEAGEKMIATQVGGKLVSGFDTTANTLEP